VVHAVESLCDRGCRGAGFDWVLIDTEHSPNELDMVLPQLQAVAPVMSEN
jgi:2-keto-3-deoxy-L-rhamnonate aldolase RhmA